MAAYAAFIFAKQQDNISYMKDVAAVIKTLAGANFKRAESAAAITTLAFITQADRAAVTKAFLPLWRPEQRVWVFPLDGEPKPILIDKALMEWVRKAEGS